LKYPHSSDGFLGTIFKKIYYDSSNPASVAGPDKLYRFARKDGKFVLSKYKIKKMVTTTGTI
jgi:hypothetical protein